MAKPHSNDFRQKVIEALELNGLKKTAASQLFNISRNTINLWCRRWTQTGDVQPHPKPTSSPKRNIKDGEKFLAFVKAHREKTESQMAQLWQDPIASFHHGSRISQLIESVGCRLVYLPTSSPDLNRIEKCWAWLKSRVRQLLPQSQCLRDAIKSVLQQAVS